MTTTDAEKPDIVLYEDFVLGMEALLRGQGSFDDEEANVVHRWLADIMVGRAMLDLLRRSELDLLVRDGEIILKARSS